MNHCSADEPGSREEIFILTNASARNVSVLGFTDLPDWAWHGPATSCCEFSDTESPVGQTSGLPVPGVFDPGAARGAGGSRNRQTGGLPHGEKGKIGGGAELRPGGSKRTTIACQS